VADLSPVKRSPKPPKNCGGKQHQENKLKIFAQNQYSAPGGSLGYGTGVDFHQPEIGGLTNQNCKPQYMVWSF
jgi:hypothetical protein